MSIVSKTEEFSGRAIYKRVHDPKIIYTKSRTKTFHMLFAERPYQKSYPFSRTIYMEPRLLSFHWEKLHYVFIYEWKRLVEEYKEKTHQISLTAHIQNLYISAEWYYGNESCYFSVFSKENDYGGLPKKVWDSPHYLAKSIRHKDFLAIFKDMVETHYDVYYPGNIYTTGLKIEKLSYE